MEDNLDHGVLIDRDELIKKVCEDYGVYQVEQLPLNIQKFCKKYITKADIICEATPKYMLQNYCCYFENKI